MAIYGGGAPRLFPDFDPRGQVRLRDNVGGVEQATRFLGFNQKPVSNNLPPGWDNPRSPGPAPGGPPFEGSAIHPVLLNLIMSRGNEPTLPGSVGFRNKAPIVNRIGGRIGAANPLGRGLPARVGTDINLRDMRKLLASMNMKQMLARLGKAGYTQSYRNPNGGFKGVGTDFSTGSGNMY